MRGREKPVIHGRDHGPGGADPIPAVETTGIQFNTFPQQGDYLVIETTDGGIAINQTADHDDPISIENEGDGVISISAAGDGPINIATEGAGDINIQLNGTGVLTIDGLPTSAPGTTNTVWNDGGTLKIT